MGRPPWGSETFDIDRYGRMTNRTCKLLLYCSMNCCSNLFETVAGRLGGPFCFSLSGFYFCLCSSLCLFLLYLSFRFEFWFSFGFGLGSFLRRGSDRNCLSRFDRRCVTFRHGEGCSEGSR